MGHVQNPPAIKIHPIKIHPIKLHPIKIHPIQNPPDQNPPDSKSTRVKTNLFNSTQTNGRSELHLARLHGLTF